MSCRTRRGFTLAELLVVITIIGILMALLFPAINAAREAARKVDCTNNQNQLAKGCLNFAASRQRFPAYRSYIPATNNNGVWGWIHEILPEIGRNDIYQQVLSSGINQVVVEPLLTCPSDPPPNSETAPLSYIANCGMPDDTNTSPPDWEDNGVFINRTYVTSGANTVTMEFVGDHDGWSNTILLAETYDPPTSVPGRQWGGSNSWIVETNLGMLWSTTGDENYELSALSTIRDAAYDSGSGLAAGSFQFTIPRSRHSGGFMAAFCDGHVRFISDNIQYMVYGLLLTPNGRGARSPGQAMSSAPNPSWQATPLSDKMFNQ